MARQITYINDADVTALDRLTGIDSLDNSTKNFTIEAIAQLFASTGIADPTKLSFFYNHTTGFPTAVGQVRYNFVTGLENTFGGISQVLISKNDATGTDAEVGNDITPIARFATGNDIKITDVDNASGQSYGIFHVTNVDTSNSDYVILFVSHLASTGNIANGQVSVSVLSAAVGEEERRGNAIFDGDFIPTNENTPAVSGDIFIREYTDADLIVQVDLYIFDGSSWGQPVSLTGSRGNSLSIENVMDGGVGEPTTFQIVTSNADDQELFRDTVTIQPGNDGISITNVAAINTPDLGEATTIRVTTDEPNTFDFTVQAGARGVQGIQGFQGDGVQITNINSGNGAGDTSTVTFTNSDINPTTGAVIQTEMTVTIQPGNDGVSPDFTAGTHAATAVAPQNADTLGDPTVSVGGTQAEPTLTIGVPTGLTGEKGDQGTVSLATDPISTLDPTDDATVVDVASADPNDLQLRFAIPQGHTGPYDVDVYQALANNVAAPTTLPADGEFTVDIETGELTKNTVSGATDWVLSPAHTSTQILWVTRARVNPAVDTESGDTRDFDNTDWLAAFAAGSQGIQGVVGPTPDIRPTAVAVPLQANNVLGTPTATRIDSPTDDENPEIQFGIPIGQKGDTGDTPDFTSETHIANPVAPTDTTTLGAPTIAIGGTVDDPIVTIGVPTGLTGEQGDTPDFTTGTHAATEVAPVDADTLGTPTVAVGGTAEDPVLTIGVPTGLTGETGDTPDFTSETHIANVVAPVDATTLGTPTIAIGGTVDDPIMTIGVPTGLQGDTGDPGADGRTIHNGSEDPTNSTTTVNGITVQNGDFYLNTTTLTFFGPYNSVDDPAWGVGRVLEGDDGMNGMNGVDGPGYTNLNVDAEGLISATAINGATAFPTVDISGPAGDPGEDSPNVGQNGVEPNPPTDGFSFASADLPATITLTVNDDLDIPVGRTMRVNLEIDGTVHADTSFDGVVESYVGTQLVLDIDSDTAVNTATPARVGNFSSDSTHTLQVVPSGAAGGAGSDGMNGVDGDSAYEVAVANGFTGTQTQWLASLIGAMGADGMDGEIFGVPVNTDFQRDAYNPANITSSIGDRWTLIVAPGTGWSVGQTARIGYSATEFFDATVDEREDITGFTRVIVIIDAVTFPNTASTTPLVNDADNQWRIGILAGDQIIQDATEITVQQTAATYTLRTSTGLTPAAVTPANTDTTGPLSSTDWDSFNAKQTATKVAVGATLGLDGNAGNVLTGANTLVAGTSFRPNWGLGLQEDVGANTIDSPNAREVFIREASSGAVDIQANSISPDAATNMLGTWDFTVDLNNVLSNDSVGIHALSSIASLQIDRYGRVVGIVDTDGGGGTPVDPVADSVGLTGQKAGQGLGTVTSFATAIASLLDENPLSDIHNGQSFRFLRTDSAASIDPYEGDGDADADDLISFAVVLLPSSIVVDHWTSGAINPNPDTYTGTYDFDGAGDGEAVAATAYVFPYVESSLTIQIVI